jgi:general secretion pathway protein L
MPTIAGAVHGLVDEVTAFLEPKKATVHRRNRVILAERGDEFEIYRVGGKGVALVTRGPLDTLRSARLPRQVRALPIEVRVDGSRVLTKILRVPAAGRSYLDPIVRHQLDRATPWSADRVVFDYAVADDEPAGEGQIAVRLVATSRDVLDQSMARLKAAKIEADVVGTSEDPIDRPSSVNLLQSVGAGQRAQFRRRVKTTLLAILLIGVLLSVLTGWQLYTVNATAAQLDSEMGNVRAGVESARAGMSLSDSRQRLLARKQDDLPLVVLVDKLSALTPANTYLRELTIEDGEVHLVGLSSDAPALIGILEADDALSDVRFAAPTMRDEAETLDRFEITARFTPAPAGDTAESPAPAEPQPIGEN